MPLRASPASVELEFEPVLDFGNVVLDRKTTRTIVIHNRGTKAAVFTTAVDRGVPLTVTSPLKAVDGTLTAQPAAHLGRSSVPLDVTFTATEAGAFAGHIDLRLKDSPDAHYRIEVRAAAAEQKLELFEPGSSTPVSAMQLDTAFFGSRRAYTVDLFNNGPLPAQFGARINAQAAPPAGAGGLAEESSYASSNSFSMLARARTGYAWTVGLNADGRT